jgi:hypothetical protein
MGFWLLYCAMGKGLFGVGQAEDLAKWAADTSSFRALAFCTYVYGLSFALLAFFSSVRPTPLDYWTTEMYSKSFVVSAC